MKMTAVPFLMPNESQAPTKEDVLAYCGKAFGMCYLQDDFEQIKNESTEKSIKRAKACIASGHHSGFEHVKFTFVIEGISKIMAMVLNNQKSYATSEKSGRYRVLEFDEEKEKMLREKWQAIFYEILSEKYYDTFYRFYAKPDVPAEKIKNRIELAIVKKAQENSRLITGTFAKTKMVYSINARQLSYLRYELKEFIKEASSENQFILKLKKEMEDFLKATEEYGLEEDGLNPGAKGIKLPFFEVEKERAEEFGENYSMNYYASCATFAQLQRHRTCHYSIQIPDEKKFFIPAFIEENEELVNEWISDLESVTTEEDFPQATMLLINERGRYENFIEKAQERLCGAAQYEISMLTKWQLEKYLENVTSENAYKQLSKINKGARCAFGYKCTAPCMFGAKYALDRKF